MSVIRRDLEIDDEPIVQMESDHLKVDVVPQIGGRIVNILEKSSGHRFLWHNQGLRLKALPPGSEYDPNFYGGIDELLPNDIPECVDRLDLPDHGELWTASLEDEIDGECLILRGVLPISGLRYERRMRLVSDQPVIVMDYRIENRSEQPRAFLWKLHAALEIEAGDQIVCPAKTARVVDLEWSRRKTLEPFCWPEIEGDRADIIPANDNTIEFFYLYDLKEGRVGWQRPSAGLEFSYRFDTEVFPFVWYFASYGGFDGHYTAILEPCTAMPILLNEASALGQ